MKIILASESPRRKELMRQIGLEFQVLSCGGEAEVTATEPAQIVREHARQKAEAVADYLKNYNDAEIPEKLKQEMESYVIIGSDTVVAFENHVLEKPKDREDAIQMLSRLQGSTHQVYTGVFLLGKDKKGERKKSVFHECTQVTFYEMSEIEIQAYVETCEPMDKAGSYGIQGLGAKFVKSICGDYNNVVGLPVARLYQELKNWEI
ncbi:MAG: Maf family protein [Lachnospiraceae bacterium]|nr:Maf family protein [Lachnospiraceae bacterium]